MDMNTRNYIGKPEQLFSVREGRFSGGKADGVRFIEVDNGTGLNVTLLCESALLPEEIDAERERQDAENARAELKKAQSRRDYLLSRHILMDAVNNLKVKEKQSIN